jgi:hypothetical protein
MDKQANVTRACPFLSSVGGYATHRDERAWLGGRDSNFPLRSQGFLHANASSKKVKLSLCLVYVGVLISLWLFLFPIFLFAARPKEFFLDGLKK